MHPKYCGADPGSKPPARSLPEPARAPSAAVTFASMRARSGRARFAGVAGVALVALAVVLAPAAGSGAAPPKHPALATCFWEGPITMKRPTTRGFDGHYFNFPEESATYWMSRFKLPDGAKLVLKGRYPHARYISLNAYSDGAPTDALSDVAIRPNPAPPIPSSPGTAVICRSAAGGSP